MLAKDLKTSSDFLMKRGTLLIVISCFIQISRDNHHLFPYISIIAAYCSHTHTDQWSLEVARMESSGHSPSSELLDKARFVGISTSGARF